MSRESNTLMVRRPGALLAATALFAVVTAAPASNASRVAYVQVPVQR